MLELSLLGTFAPGSESSIGWNFRSLELSLPGTFVPGSESSMELSLPGTFVPWNFRSRERKFHGTFAPWNFRSQELSLPRRKSESLSSDTNGKNFGSCRRCVVNSSVLMVLQLKMLGLSGISVSWDWNHKGGCMTTGSGTRAAT